MVLLVITYWANINQWRFPVCMYVPCPCVVCEDVVAGWLYVAGFSFCRLFYCVLASTSFGYAYCCTSELGCGS